MKQSSMRYAIRLWMIWLSVTTAQQQPQQQIGYRPCETGSCPTPSLYAAEAQEESKCGLWMGPSLIKEKEQHGFGLGVFTGKHIREGATVDAETLVPVMDWEGVQEDPPLKEHLWNGENLPLLAMQSHWGAFYFVPGLGCIVPCTSVNFNLRLTNKYLEYMEPHDHPATGSFSRYQSMFFEAVREISPGEELVVECSDDDFDGGTYALSKYHQTDDKEEIMCLDDTLGVAAGTANPDASGKAVYAKRNIKKGEVVFSSPLVPISRTEMEIPKEIKKEYEVPDQQLLLNYAFGHPDSDLLLLPYGPTVNYINHHSDFVNVEVRWHTPKEYSKPLTKRQEHHHPELLEVPGRMVSQIHGKGLMFDYVATKDIQEGHEIFLDYGDEWTKAWDQYAEKWDENKRDYHYESAMEYSNKHNMQILKTPKEQMNHPYPPNIMFTCEYPETWVDPAPGESYVQHRFDENEFNACLLPCTIEGRYEKEVDENDPEDTQPEYLYRVKLLEVSNHTNVAYDCLIVDDVEYEYFDVPRDVIFVTDRPYTTDYFQPYAFRHEIQVPDGLYPDAWLEKKSRVRRRETVKVSDLSDHSFKRRLPKNLPDQNKI
ncbi:unnamed protein product [Cylindrotheca closterium]|uniref:SET domain-containing protein n=1 Tax=Cylindrotheca closterium TaxID=2856 RepID=A0AAD2FNW6_9STRA|nr:unnamed protein product [Cylindrotheca closterium]